MSNIECCGLCSAAIVVEGATQYTTEGFPACHTCAYGEELAYLAKQRTIFVSYSAHDPYYVRDFLGRRIGNVSCLINRSGVVTGAVTDVIGQTWGLRAVPEINGSEALLIKRRSL